MADRTLDASGLRCPMPLLKTKLELNGMTSGQTLLVIATDSGSARDIPAYLALTRHELVSSSEEGDQYTFMIKCAG
ncbi:sulfurtransferase TusA family protein [Marinobacter confluentis]|uniref:Sulfurtransferase TusA family protein n=1 Tax=Marinobacter confluentis TaxID=1697557 RepID=A0A4Z1C4Z8_9GAMM|nr:sulfurtransferase TusA family protein [Marinobacter confluentis]TGN41481.1 sulfurtransferase TusA family protein [Marinobacter confluentis]